MGALKSMLNRWLDRLIFIAGLAAVLVLSAGEALPIVEHVTGVAFWHGSCRIVNVKAIHGSGLLFGGVFSDPTGGREGHIRGYKSGRQIDVACPLCRPEKVQIYLLVEDYRVIAVKSDGSKAAEANEWYVRKALWADRVLDYIQEKRRRKT